MNILENVKQQQLQARKTGDVIARNVLTTLLGEINTAQKKSVEFGDAEISAVVVKFIKNAKEMSSLQTDDIKRNETLREIDILQNLLPQQLTQEQLTEAINKIIADNNVVGAKQFGLVMKQLKEQFNNQYDASIASGIIKGILK